jgi:hypothetical protein
MSFRLSSQKMHKFNFSLIIAIIASDISPIYRVKKLTLISPCAISSMLVFMATDKF